MPVEFRHVFKLADGETILCAHKEAQRTLDRRTAYGKPEVVWEVKTPKGPIRRLWPEDIAEWTLERL